MQHVIEAVRRIVVLVLLMEFVLRMQSGKQYEAYIKMLVGVMVVYTITTGIYSLVGKNASFSFPPMQDFVWEGEAHTEEYAQTGECAETGIQVDAVEIPPVKIEEIQIGK